MFVNKHTETIYVKKEPTFKKKDKLHAYITREFLELRM